MQKICQFKNKTPKLSMLHNKSEYWVLSNFKKQFCWKILAKQLRLYNTYQPVKIQYKLHMSVSGGVFFFVWKITLCCFDMKEINRRIFRIIWKHDKFLQNAVNYFIYVCVYVYMHTHIKCNYFSQQCKRDQASNTNNLIYKE